MNISNFFRRPHRPAAAAPEPTIPQLAAGLKAAAARKGEAMIQHDNLTVRLVQRNPNGNTFLLLIHDTPLPTPIPVNVRNEWGRAVGVPPDAPWTHGHKDAFVCAEWPAPQYR